MANGQLARAVKTNSNFCLPFCVCFMCIIKAWHKQWITNNGQPMGFLSFCGSQLILPQCELFYRWYSYPKQLSNFSKHRRSQGSKIEFHEFSRIISRHFCHSPSFTPCPQLFKSSNNFNNIFKINHVKCLKVSLEKRFELISM